MSPELPDRAVVLLGDREVGALIRLGESSRFEPAEGWAEQPAGERPVLGQQFEEDPWAAHLGRTRMGVPLWFEHLLPETGGLLRAAVARALDVSPTRGFALLLALGEDLPGSVRVRAVDGEAGFRTVARRVSEALGADVDAPRPLRASLSGIQFKISARLGHRGLSVPGWDDEGDWIVKFADPTHADLPAIELVTMRWASLAGLDVPRTRLVRTAGIEGIERLPEVRTDTAFAIERYDRTPRGRVHQEDFAQVLGLGVGEAKYQGANLDTILRVVSALAPEDLDELIGRIVFCALAGNDDGHAKTWSLWYPHPARPRLSPAYDLVSTVCFPQYAANDMALKLAGSRRFGDVTLARLQTLGQRAGLDGDRVASVAHDAARGQIAACSQARELPEILSGHRDAIDERLRTLRLAREVGGRR